MHPNMRGLSPKKTYWVFKKGSAFGNLTCAQEGKRLDKALVGIC